MKKLVLLIAAIMVALAILLPFISTTPDGLETLTETSGKAQQPVWNGIMGDYSVAVANPYLSTLIAGLLGTAIVLVASYALGAIVTQKKKTQTAKNF